jgi:hypothetical protein
MYPPTNRSSAKRSEYARQELWNRIYVMDYIAIPALQLEYERQVDRWPNPEATIDEAREALQLAQDNLAQLKKELRAMDARHKQGEPYLLQLLNQLWHRRSRQPAPKASYYPSISQSV